MSVDINFLSSQLLERLANSIHDRDAQINKDFCFNISEVHVVEKWLSELIIELKSPKVEDTNGLF